MPQLASRFIDLTPWIRNPSSGVGLTAWYSYQAMHRMDPELQAISRSRGEKFRWMNPVERMIGRKNALYHSFEHRMPPLGRSVRLLSIHDLWTLEKGNAWQAPEFQERQAPLLEQAIRRAHWITTPSRSVLRQLHERFPQTRGISQCVPWGPILDPQALDDSTTLPRPTERPYFLTVASYETRKNLPFILNAIRGLAGFDWVFAGKPGHGSDAVLHELKNFAAHSQVRFHFLQDLSASGLVNLYRHCEAVVLPSQDEGFGLPALEAAAMGRPLILSNIDPFREIALDAALYFDPIHGAEALRAHLLQILEDKALSRKLATQASLRSQLFSWDKTARSLLDLHRRLGS
jgi:glycosyltransferase involved in cell wall biosynthesis